MCCIDQLRPQPKAAAQIPELWIAILCPPVLNESCFSGEWLGQLAQFEAFGDVGDAVTAAPGGEPFEKGARRVYRPMKTNPILTKAEVETAIAENRSVFAGRSAMAGNKLPVSDFLVGKELTLRFDNGPVVEYRFDEIDKLRWRRER